MNESLKERVRRFLQVRRHRKTWEKVVGSLAVVVIFITSYMLILPAITMEKPTYCGNTHHTHTASCYEPSEEILDEDNVSGSTGSSTSASTPAHTWATSLSIEGIEEVRTGGEDEGLAEAESESESESESETESESESETESETSETVTAESETDESEKAVAEAQTEEVSEAESELQSEAATKIERASNLTAESETEALTEAQSESETVAQTEAVTEAETELESDTIENEETEVTTENALETETETNLTEDIALYAEDIIDEGDDGIATYANDGIDFTDYITSVDMKYKDHKEEWKGWQDIPVQDGKLQLSEKDSLQFQLNYTLPGQTLSQTNRTIVYQIPDGITIKNQASGNVTNTLGQVIGTYVIGTDGKISITFEDEYVNENADGKAVTGHIIFKSSVSEIETDDTGKKEISFNDKVNIKVEVVDKVITTEDLHVEKSALKVNEQDGTIEYQIVITSKAGTSDKVTLTDIMKNVGLDGDITVVDKNGTQIPTTFIENADGFSMELPSMPAGESYTITYRAKLTDTINGKITTNNTVKVDSKRQDGAKLHDEASVDNEITQKIISKTGKLLENGKIQWTVTINESKTDIGGWTLSDVLNGQAFEGTVSITPAIEGKTEITLPYTFPKGTKDTYTVVYDTSADKEVGNNKTSNKAVLTPPAEDGKKPANAGAAAGDNTSKPYNPVQKAGQGISENSDGETAIAKWKVTISASEGDIAAPWTYTDTLEESSHNQWFTADQILQVKKALDQTLKDAGIELDYTMFADGNKNLEDVKPESDTKYSGYKITFNTPLKKGTTFSFEYKTTANIKNLVDAKIFKNSGFVSENTKSYGQNTFKPSKPTIIKNDASKTGGEDNTSHTYDDITADGKSVIKWNITVNIPENYQGGALTIKEKLPDGVTLDYLGLGIAAESKTDITTSGNHEVGGYTVETTITGNTILVKIPEEMAESVKGSRLELVVHVIPDEDTAWTTGNKSFQNEVELLDKNNNVIGTDSQTQTIQKDKEKQYVKKQADKVEDNVISYSVLLNLNGEDLLEGAKTLTLDDELEYKYYEPNGILDVSLVPGSVKLYKCDETGNKLEELSTVDYPYTYVESKEEDNGKNWTCKNKLSITIPNKQAVRVEYKYKVTGPVGQWHNFSNTAELKGVLGDNSGGKNNVHTEIQESSAGAELDGVTIYKVDSNNTGLGLAGAEFELARWDVTEGKYVVVKPENGEYYISDANGKMSLIHLAYNTAYRLVEKKQPDGYILDSTPFYFCIGNSDKQKYPVCQPEDFEGTEYASGAVIYLTNIKNLTDIRVDKKWLDSNANPVNKPSGDVKIELYQISTTKNPYSAAREKATVNILYGKYGVDAGNLGKSETQVCQKGDLIIIQVVSAGTPIARSYNPRSGDFYNNYKEIAASSVSGESPKVYEYRYKVKGDITIGIITSENNEINASSSVNSADTEPLVTEKLYGTYQISAGENWSKAIKNLPLAGTDSSGNTVYYSYYVKEISLSNYITSYENNGGITSGTITITNQSTENPSYVLPETGGPGTLPYIAGGLAVMTAGLLYGYSLRRRRERRLG